jgi:iron complex transport system ATP-binding protein
MIRTEHITVDIASRLLLDDVSVSFMPGSLNLIIGPNGAGKSTLIKVLSGQMRATRGRVFYDDTDLSTMSPLQLSKSRAVLSQNIFLAFPMKVSEVVMMGRYPHFANRPGVSDERSVAEAMSIFDVEKLKDRDYTTLSGGEKQRVHFARVFAQLGSPGDTGHRYLMLDEPLTFLDVHYQYAFMRTLNEFLREPGLVVVGVVHDLNLAARFAETLLLLSGGRVLATGDREHVLTIKNVKEAFQLEPVINRSERTGAFYLFFE